MSAAPPSMNVIVVRLTELAEDLGGADDRAREAAAARGCDAAAEVHFVAGWVAGEARAASFVLEQLAAQLRGDR